MSHERRTTLKIRSFVLYMKLKTKMCVSFMEQKGTIIQPTYNFLQPKTTPNLV